jgi:hypothetical protein
LATEVSVSSIQASDQRYVSESIGEREEGGDGVPIMGIILAASVVLMLIFSALFGVVLFKEQQRKEKERKKNQEAGKEAVNK